MPRSQILFCQQFLSKHIYPRKYDEIFLKIPTKGQIFYQKSWHFFSNLRILFCRTNEHPKINEVPDTLDQKIWPDIEKLIDQNKLLDAVFIVDIIF